MGKKSKSKKGIMEAFDGKAKKICVKATKLIVNELKNLDSNIKESVQIKDKIGKQAILIKKEVRRINKRRKKKEQISFKRFLEELFNCNANRVYEAMAIHRALSNAAPPTLNVTSLIRIGQKIGNKATKDKMIAFLETNKVENGSGKTVLIKDAKTNELMSALKQIQKTGAHTTFKSIQLNKIATKTENINEEINRCKKIFLEDIERDATPNFKISNISKKLNGIKQNCEVTIKSVDGFQEALEADTNQD